MIRGTRTRTYLAASLVLAGVAFVAAAPMNDALIAHSQCLNARFETLLDRQRERYVDAGEAYFLTRDEFARAVFEPCESLRVKAETMAGNRRFANAEGERTAKRMLRQDQTMFEGFWLQYNEQFGNGRGWAPDSSVSTL